MCAVLIGDNERRNIYRFQVGALRVAWGVGESDSISEVPIYLVALGW